MGEGIRRNLGRPNVFEHRRRPQKKRERQRHTDQAVIGHTEKKEREQDQKGRMQKRDVEGGGN